MNRIRSITALFLYCCCALAAAQDRLAQYSNIIETKGLPPVAYVLQKLKTHDLILFDDSHHQAVEPFEFYQKLLRTKAFTDLKPLMFVELFDITAQPHIDAFLHAPKKNLSLLNPAFLSSYSPYALNLKTYYDLMSTVYDVNKELTLDNQIQVVGVSTPALWPMINNQQDYKAFQKTLAGRDHDMYRAILGALDNFAQGKKGIFLTNTRHAYTGIKNSSGQFYWNTGTFFRQWHPGKSFSIRIHGPQLFITKRNKGTDSKDVQGLNQFDYRWDRMEKGLWDSAFARNDNLPVGFDLALTPFGNAQYAGNHMLNVAGQQTMSNAFDGLIFLKPLEQLTSSAKVNLMYDTSAKEELIRRLKIYHNADEFNELKRENDVSSDKDLAELLTVSSRSKPLVDTSTMASLDQWKTKL